MLVIHPDRCHLYRNAALALQRQAVKILRAHGTLRHRARDLQKPVSQSGLAGINMRDNDEIPYISAVLHMRIA